MVKIRQATPRGLLEIEAIRVKLRAFLDANRKDFTVRKRGKITEFTYIGS